MKCYYDLHIHSCLSPCSDADMTPNNIVNMAVLKELDVIAVTDHNSMANLPAVMKAAEGNELCVLYGMEVETSEEVHVLALFDRPEGAFRFEEAVKKSMPGIKNRIDIFGNQSICDEHDNIVEEYPNLLVTASNISIYDAAAMILENGGAFVPAHIDRNSYSILSNLGWIPGDLPVKTLEISKNTSKSAFNAAGLEKYQMISSSDAHHLWDISEREEYIEIDSITAQNVILYLNGKT